MRGRWRATGLDAWPLLLAVVLLAPLLTGGGHPLARDLVFVPRQPWTEAVLGLGDVSPRAVPLDALVSPLTLLVDGGVLARIVLPLVLAVAGWGAHRLVADLGVTARLVAGGFAVWNPFVVERLALGQWALLAAYAALPWLALAVRRHREDGGWGNLARVTLWLALASITPGGGLIAVATVLVLGLARTRRALGLVAVSLALQLPWLVPGLVGTASLMSDPAGVGAFAARGEGVGGVLVSTVGLGGIWDAGSVPGSRETGWVAVSALVTVAVLVAGRRGLVRLWGPGDGQRWALLGVAALVLAVSSSTPWGADVLRWAVQEVPGAGLLRDSQKLLAPLVVLVVAAAAVTAQRMVDAAARAGTEVGTAVAVVVAASPLVLLPDATAAVWPTVEPVTYPEAVANLESVFPPDDTGAAVTLPWRSYRRFDWGNGETSSDPAVRLLDRPVVVRDDLLVGETLVRGESILARDLGAELESEPPAAVLPDYGIRWAVVYPDDPAADDLDLEGLTLHAASDAVRVYRVPPNEPASRLPETDPRPGIVAVLDVTVAGLVVGAAGLRVRGAARATAGSRSRDRTAPG